MKKGKNEKQKVKLHKLEIDEVKITDRARSIVEKIVSTGRADHHDIASKCGTTVLSLLDGAKPTLQRPHFISLATHYSVSILWLWTGQGPQFIKHNSN